MRRVHTAGGRLNRGDRINRITSLAYAGKLSRRELIAGLMALSVPASVALATGAHAQRSAANQANNRRALQTSYDYVIVGSGSAGCLIANRLSEDPLSSVLLLEAGNDDLGLPEVRDAGAWSANLRSPRVWSMDTAPHRGPANRTVHVLSGQTLGGSGRVNVMIWLMGDPRDYRAWTEFGGPDWGYESCRQSLLALERYLEDAKTLRGLSGPYPVTQATRAHELTGAWLAACSEFGLPEIALNGGGPLDGTGALDCNILDGRRMGPAQVLLQPVMDRPNLTILTGARVERITLRGTRATGVSVRFADQTLDFAASSETVLCGGALRSPQILQRSGIGPPEVLAQAGIDTVHALDGVGRNLQDHVLCPCSLKAKPGLQPPVGSGYCTEVFARTNPIDEAPNLHLLTGHVNDTPYADLGVSGAFSILFGLGKPVSRGVVEVQSPDSAVPARIDPDYLGSTADQNAVLEAMDLALTLADSKSIGRFAESRLHPGEMGTRAERLAYVKQDLVSYWHYVGTCRMGSDPLAVVEPDLKVRGIDALRVADASVIPEIPCVNTQVPTLIVAHQAAARMLA
jgi:choline dehydrogenase